MFGNWFKTTLLMAAIVALFGVIGAMLGGKSGMLLALLIAGGMNLWAYWFSDSLVLKMYQARQVDAQTAPELYGMIKELATNAGLPMPKVYLIHEDQPNAFATGRNPENAAVAATTGIMRVLSHRELRSVMAHELAHVKHRDTLISTVSATIAGAISSLANFALFFSGSNNNERNVHPIVAILIMILAPIAATLIQLAISRAREFEADAGGAAISKDPLSLATALEKIERYAQGVPMSAAEHHPETAQMMIINPLTGGGMQDLFRTHPRTAERIARLHEIARNGITH
jgi:heat shock protein HtpX